MVGNTLGGLAERWEADEVLRRRLLDHHALMQWKDPASTGTASMQHAKFNYLVLKPLFELWALSSPLPRTPSLSDIRKEAPSYVHIGHVMCVCVSGKVTVCVYIYINKEIDK